MTKQTLLALIVLTVLCSCVSDPAAPAGGDHGSFSQEGSPIAGSEHLEGSSPGTPPPPQAAPTTTVAAPSAAAPVATVLPADLPVWPLSGTGITAQTLAQVQPLRSFGGHSPSVAALSISGDGLRLSSASKNFALRIWDLETAGELRAPAGSGERIYNALFSADGSLLATEGEDQSVQLWDIESGRPMGTLAGHGTHLLAMAFSGDGRLLATAGDDALIKLWDLETGQELQTLEHHLTPVTALAFSADGSMLASGGSRFSNIIQLWDVASGEPGRTLTGHSGDVGSLAFSPDGTLLASGSQDRTLRLWSIESASVVHLLRDSGDPVFGLAFSPDGALLASSGDLGSVLLWDVQSGEELAALDGHSNSVFMLAFSPDGSLLASGGIDSSVLVWGIPGEGGGSAEAYLPQAQSATLSAGPALNWGAGNGLLAFTSYRDGEGKIFVMDAEGGGVTRVSRTSRRETRPDWSPDGTRIAYVRRVSDSDHEIYVMNADGSDATRLTHRPNAIDTEPAWSPDGTRIAFISNERPNSMTFTSRFQVWVMDADGSNARLMTEIGGSNSSPSWSPDGSHLVFDSTRDGNHEIYVMNADGSDPVNLSLHPAHDTSPAWSPDGRQIAFVSDRDGNQEIYVMNADGSGQRRLTDHPWFDKAPAWSPDGQYIVYYTRTDENNTEVYRIRANGSDPVRLTHHSNFDGFPSWQPIPQPGRAQGAAAAGLLAQGRPTLTDVSERLQGLPFDQFLDESFRLLLLRDPEWVTIEGLAEVLGTDNGQLTDLSDAYVRETYQMLEASRDLLLQYRRDQLSPAQQISYDVYEWYLTDQLRGQQFMYYDYPVNHVVTSVHFNLMQLFTDLHPVRSKTQAEEYVRRLTQVDTKLEGLIEGLQLRREAGIVLPRLIFPWFEGDIQRIAGGSARYTPFYATLEQKLASVEGLRLSEHRALLQSAEEAIAGSVIPAYKALASTLSDLKQAAPAKEGIWQFPDGQAYYEYTLRHHTTTDLSADEIHQMGLRELERIQAEMRAVFQQLGYPRDGSIAALYARAEKEDGYISGSQAAGVYEQIIDEAERNLADAFDLLAQAEVIVIAGPRGDYYQSASIDGTRPGAFYARIEGGTARLGMPTLAYHETVPGHHLQIAIAQESDLPLVRNILALTGYTEGWALYAEELAYELGWYEDDLYGNLGRLQAQAFRAARMVVDTGLHAKRWTFDQAVDFMVENTGLDRGFMQFEVSRYIVWPGQAPAYMVGKLKIQELRQLAMDRLGERFDLVAFHREVLSNGSMPLEVLERVVEAWIEEVQAAGDLSREEAATLRSLELVHPYPLYTMHYQGAYGDSQAALPAARSWATVPPWGCSLFAALGDPAGHLYGRNFDWRFSPALLLFTDPPGGYASVSMVDIAYLVGEDQVRDLHQAPLAERLPLLEAPYWPFDGMNEQGLAVGMAAVPTGHVPPDPAKETIGSLGIIRQMLDHASTVDEAVQLLQSYNIDMEGGPDLHYLIADRSGRSALVEFHAGEVVVLPNEDSWQVATNFLRSAVSGSPEGVCHRFDALSTALTQAGGRLQPAGALDLLGQVAQSNTQWSVVYGLASGEVRVRMNLDPAGSITRHLPLSSP